MNVLDLFSGIGGFSLGLEAAGMHTVAFCEREPFCQSVLRKHWPSVPIFDDVRTLDGTQWGGAIDVICGGYPCQPFSVAGKQLGHEDERHLWPEMLRIIREVKATKPEKELWVIAENVTGHIELGFDEVAASLEAEGFTVWAFVIPASSIGAIHRRDRVWIIAHSNGIGLQGRRKEWSGERVKALPQAPIWRDVPAPYVCRADDGIPDRAHRLKAIGNAVHPYITEIIGHAIMQYRGEIA